MMKEMGTKEILCSSSLFEDGFGPSVSNEVKFHDTESLAASHDGALHSKGLTLATCSLLIIGQMAGSGVLALPKATLNTGWTGLSLLIICGLIAMYCGIRLGESWILLRNRVIAYKSHVRDPYPIIAFECYGSPAKRFVELCVIMTLFGVCVVFLIISAQNIASLTNFHFGLIAQNQGFRIWILICCLSLLPFNYLATPKDIWPLALAAFLSTLVACFLITTKSVLDSPKDLLSVPRGEVSLESFFSGFATIAFTFGGAAIFPTFQTDMRRPKEFSKAVMVGFAVVMLMYLPTACLPYLVYGVKIKDNILHTLKISDSYSGLVIGAEAVLTAHLLATYVVTLNPIFQQVEEYFRAPKDFSIKRVAIRTSIVLLVLGVAEAVPHFAPILELVGGTSVTLMAFVFPCLFYLRLKRDCPLYIKIFHVEIILIATMSGCLSTYSAVRDLQKAYD